MVLLFILLYINQVLKYLPRDNSIIQIHKWKMSLLAPTTNKLITTLRLNVHTSHQALTGN